MSDKDDPKPRTRKGSRKKSPADIAAEAEAAAAAAEAAARTRPSSDLAEISEEAAADAEGAEDLELTERVGLSWTEPDPTEPDQIARSGRRPASSADAHNTGARRTEPQEAEPQKAEPQKAEPQKAEPQKAELQGRQRQVENWLAARLAALDPGEDDEDVSDPSTQIGKSPVAARPPTPGRATGTPSSWPTQSPANPRAAGPARMAPGPQVPRPAQPIPASVEVEPTRISPERERAEVDEDEDPPTLSLADAQMQGLHLGDAELLRPDLSPTVDLTTVPASPDLEEEAGRGPAPAPQLIDPQALAPAGSSQAPSLEVMVVGTSERTPPLPPRQPGDLPSIELVEDEKTPIPQEAWPDFEPLSLPSEEIEPLDDAATTPDTSEPSEPSEPGYPRGSRQTPNRPELYRDEQTWDLLGESDGRGRPALTGLDEVPTRHDAEHGASGPDDLTGPGGWAARTPPFGQAIAGPGPARVMVGPGAAPSRGTPPAASALTGLQAEPPGPSATEPTLIKPEDHSEEGRQPRSSPPVIKSAAAPVRPRSPNEEARYDALIAEVSQKSEPPRTDAPRRKPGPFSRWNEDTSDPGERRRGVSSTPLAQTPGSTPAQMVESGRFSSQPEPQTEIREPESSEGLYDEMFPHVQGHGRGEETSALLSDSADPTPMPPPPPILPRIAQSQALAAALRPLQESQNSPLSLGVSDNPAPERESSARYSEEDVDDPGSKTEWRPRAHAEVGRQEAGGRQPVDLDKKPLADEKTEIRSFSPKIDTVGDDEENAPTTRMSSQEERVAPITAADLPQTPPPTSGQEDRRHVGPMTWVVAGAGTVVFLAPLAFIVVIAIWWMQ